MKIICIKRGCPLCGNDVKGNMQVKYFCKSCFMYFTEENVNGNLYVNQKQMPRFRNKV